MNTKPTSRWQEIERKTTATAHAAEIQDYKKQIKQYQAVVEELDAQLDIVSVLREQPSVKGVFKVEHKKSIEHEATAVAICSDWHVEETVDPATVNFLNSYGLDIADARIERLTRSILRLVQIERNGTDIRTLILAILGDLMTGYIHEELREENGLSPTQTILWLRERLTKMVNTLRKEGGFDQIVIPVSIGNHGRTTIKPRHGSAYKNSYEWLLYKVLEQDLTDGVKWIVGNSYHTYLDVYDKVFRLHHGDGLKYQGGIGGLTIPVEKAIAAWNKARVADLDIFGHWHQSQQNPKWISNGSLIGHNAYAISIKAGFEPPSQTLFLFNGKRGRIGTFPVFVE